MKLFFVYRARTHARARPTQCTRESQVARGNPAALSSRTPNPLPVSRFRGGAGATIGEHRRIADSRRARTSLEREDARDGQAEHERLGDIVPVHSTVCEETLLIASISTESTKWYIGYLTSRLERYPNLALKG